MLGVSSVEACVLFVYGYGKTRYEVGGVVKMNVAVFKEPSLIR